MSIKYSDLLGNEFIQTVSLDIDIYEFDKGDISDYIKITRIRYPDGKIRYMKPKRDLFQ